MDFNQILTVLLNQGPVSFLLGVAVYYFYQEIQKLKKENTDLRETIMENELKRNLALTEIIEANTTAMNRFTEVFEEHLSKIKR